MSQVDQAFLKAFSKGRLPLENSTASQVPAQPPQVLPSAPNKHVVAHSSHATPSIHVSQTSVRKSSSTSVSNSRIDNAHLPDSSQASESNPKSIYFRSPEAPISENPLSRQASPEPTRQYAPSPSSPTSLPPRRSSVDPLLNQANSGQLPSRATYKDPVTGWTPIVESNSGFASATPTSPSSPSSRDISQSAYGHAPSTEAAPHKIAKPISLASSPVPAAGERVTLRSYFEQAKPEEIAIRELPAARPTIAHLDTEPASEFEHDVAPGISTRSRYATPPYTASQPTAANPNAAKSSEIPTVASRFQKNVAIHAAHPQTEQLLHPHLHPTAAPEHNDFYPPVQRPEGVSPWQGFTVERNIKATADSQSMAARMNTATSAHSSHAASQMPYAPEIDSEAERITAEWIAAKSGKSASYRLDEGNSRNEQSSRNEQASTNRNKDLQDLYPSADYPPDDVSTSPHLNHATIHARTHFGQLPSQRFDEEDLDDFDSTDSDDRPPFATPTSTYATTQVKASSVATENKPTTYPGRTTEQQAAPKSKATSAPALETDLRVASPLQPVWEVDDFTWPAIVAKLLQTQDKAFEEIGLHLQHAHAKGLRVVSVTSGERGVGRSTVSMCLAKAIARTGLRVALVDGDYECPSLVDQFNLEIEHGWQGCLLQNVPLEEAAIISLHDNVCLFPLTESLSLTQVSRHEQRIQKLFKRISNAFDMVIIDSNRLNQKQYQLLGTGKEGVVDAALVIVDSQLSLQQRVDNAIELLKTQGIHSIGLAENFHS